MPDKDPSNISLITYGWVVILAIWGGVVHNIRKVRDGTTKRFSIAAGMAYLETAGILAVGRSAQILS